MRLRSRLLKFFTYRPSIISFGSKAKAQLAKVAIVLSVNLKSLVNSHQNSRHT